LPLLVAKNKGKNVTLRLRRAAKEGEASEAYTFEWTVPERFTVYDGGLQYNLVGLELPGSGLTYGFSTIVAGTKPTGSSEKSSTSILPGEKVLNLRLDSTNTADIMAIIEKTFTTREIKQLVEGRELKEGYNAGYLNALIQLLPVGTKLKLDFMRDGVVTPASVAVGLDRDWKSFDRGVLFQPAKLTRTATSFSEALGLGWAEIKDKSTRVVRFLRMAFTGKLPVNAAGGPGMIFWAATSAASEGTTKLLLFLTMLSANLAILNFLPIPALDGGHMVFLAWEAIFGKPVNEATQMRLTLVGVLLLLSLMAFVIVNDVVNFTKIFGM
jgi:regulator of sigma E protease